MRIYIAGPLSTKSGGDNSTVTSYIQNCNRMMKVAVALRSKGHYPYVPCLDILLGFLDGNWEYEDYAEPNLSFMEVCDALLFIGPSSGANMELKRAVELNKIIYYRLEDVPAA